MQMSGGEHYNLLLVRCEANIHQVFIICSSVHLLIGCGQRCALLTCDQTPAVMSQFPGVHLYITAARREMKYQDF